MDPNESNTKKGPSKKELKKLEKMKKKEEQEQKRKEEETRKQKEILEKYKDIFGNRPLVEGEPVDEKERRRYSRIEELNENAIDQSVWLRCRIQTSRSTGKLCFLLLRQRMSSIQGVVESGNQIPKEMVKFASSIPRESIVDVEGIVKKAVTTVESATQQSLELIVKKLFVVSSVVHLPIQFEDVSRPLPLILAQEEAIAAIEKQEEEIRNQINELKNPENKTEKKEEKIESLKQRLDELAKEKSEKQKFVIVGQNARLDNRVIDLRTAANQAIFKIQSGVCQLFRQALLAKGFIEIHTPKLIAAKSEGGANVFEVIYFKRSAYLAQSPQLYKQMAIVADFERVFEIGPVFRAEDANTPRHLTEFVGLDLEMVIHQHYHEVLDVIEDMFITIFDGLNREYRHELQIVSQQFPYEPMTYKKCRLTFPEAVCLLREAGMQIGDFEDFSTPHEKMLGKIVKEKYGTDFFVVDKFPSEVRPFYTMPDTKDPRYSNSYDFFMRGQEIVSGSQRIHDPQLLEQRAKLLNIDLEKIRPYLECFKYGAPPHGGCGVGLERVVQFFLNLDNIRRTSIEGLRRKFELDITEKNPILKKKKLEEARKTQKCQKCLQVGHATWQCKNEPVYLSRPSRTQWLKNPKKQPKFHLNELPPEPVELYAQLGKELKKMKKRKHKRSSSTSSSSSSSSSSSESSSGSDPESESESESSSSSSTKSTSTESSSSSSSSSSTHNTSTSSESESESESSSSSSESEKENKKKGKEKNDKTTKEKNAVNERSEKQPQTQQPNNDNNKDKSKDKEEDKERPKNKEKEKDKDKNQDKNKHQDKDNPSTQKTQNDSRNQSNEKEKKLATVTQKTTTTDQDNDLEVDAEVRTSTKSPKKRTHDQIKETTEKPKNQHHHKSKSKKESEKESSSETESSSESSEEHSPKRRKVSSMKKKE